MPLRPEPIRGRSIWPPALARERVEYQHNTVQFRERPVRLDTSRRSDKDDRGSSLGAGSRFARLRPPEQAKRLIDRGKGELDYQSPRSHTRNSLCSGSDTAASSVTGAKSAREPALYRGRPPCMQCRSLLIVQVLNDRRSLQPR